MSKVVRVSDEADEFISNENTENEDIADTIDRLIGLNDNSNDNNYLTEAEIRSIVDNRIEEERMKNF